MDATRIVRDFSGPDLMFVALLDDVEIGRYPTAVEADDALWAALDATPEAQAWMKQMGERVRAGAPYALLLDCAGPDVPLDGPSVEEEGGEGGEPPPDDYVAALAAHVAREYTAFLAAAPDSPAPSFLPTAPAGDAAANAAGSKKAAYLERAARARSAWACRMGGNVIAIRHQGRIVAYHPKAYVAMRCAERLAEVA